jgi:hypothetical protein
LRLEKGAQPGESRQARQGDAAVAFAEAANRMQPEICPPDAADDSDVVDFPVVAMLVQDDRAFDGHGWSVSFALSNSGWALRLPALLGPRYLPSEIAYTASWLCLVRHHGLHGRTKKMKIAAKTGKQMWTKVIDNFANGSDEEITNSFIEECLKFGNRDRKFDVKILQSLCNTWIPEMGNLPWRFR